MCTRVKHGDDKTLKAKYQAMKLGSLTSPGSPLRVSERRRCRLSPQKLYGCSTQSNCLDDYAGIWCEDNGKYEFHSHCWYYGRTDKYLSAWVPCGCTYLTRGSAPAHQIENIIFNESPRLSWLILNRLILWYFQISQKGHASYICILLPKFEIHSSFSYRDVEMSW